MATNVFSITPEHNNARLSLHGDMSLSFNEVVSNKFSIRLFTSTDELFSLDSTEFQFRDLAGNLVEGLLFGGKPGLFIELMFDPVASVWYITANNLVGSAEGVDFIEKPLTFAALPAMTTIDYSVAKNFRATLTADAKLANPINMKPGDRVRIIVIQGPGGNKNLSFDGAYSFFQALQPKLSTAEGRQDIIDLYKTSDNTIITDVKLDYSIITPLAYGSDFFFSMNAAYVDAQNNPEDGQTVRVIRDGWRLECNGTIGFNLSKPLNLRVQGVPKANGDLPLLRLDKTDRPTFGKALINIERGTNVVIEDLRIAGATSEADGNGTGILINAPVEYTLIKNVHLRDNENGVRSNYALTQQYDLINVLLEKNGWSATHPGFSHSIYAGHGYIWRGTNCTFYDPVAGHNIKSRMLRTVLNQVYSARSNQGRDLDIPDQGLVHATDCVFWKDGDAGQNNLIGIGHEMIGGSPYQEYYFINCYFHNDVTPIRDVTYLENWNSDGTPNTVAVHFIDCEFGGVAKEKGSALFKGPYTITLTGGPLGPRVPVGDPRRLFDVNSMDPDRLTNPAGIPLTPFEDLPPMTATEPTPPYPAFIEPLPPIPPLPSFGSNEPPPGEDDGSDTVAPTVSLAVSSGSVTSDGSVTLTATTSDYVGVTKVEFYRNGVLLSTVEQAPYEIVENYTTANNGTISYTARAYDAAGNNRYSTAKSVVVNIPRPVVPAGLDATTQAEYTAAIENAAMGSKRLAGANAIKLAMDPDHKLTIYQDGNVILPVVYSSGLIVTDNGTDVTITLGTPDYSEAVASGDLTQGTWTFVLSGGPEYVRTLSGSVGALGSGANIELLNNPDVGQGFEDNVVFVMPRSIDGLA